MNVLFPQHALLCALDLLYLGVTIETHAEGTTGPPATIISTWTPPPTPPKQKTFLILKIIKNNWVGGYIF